MRNIDWVEVFMKFLAICAVLFILSLFYIIPAMVAEENRIMDECKKDHKEYECVAMLRQDSSTVVMPMPIVVR